jgi:hypothetical protein
MGLESITGYEPYNYRHYQQWISLLVEGRVRSRVGVVWTDVDRIARPDLLDVLNVRYLLSPSALMLPPEAAFWPVAQFAAQPFFVPYGGMQFGEMLIYENRRVLGRVQHPRDVVVVRTETEMIRHVEQSLLRDKTVVLCPLASSSQNAKTRQPRIFSQIMSWKAGKIDLLIRSEGRRFVRVSEIWHPGWSAVSDGRSIPLFRTDLSLLGFWVAAGEHRVSLRFRPLTWPWTLGLSGVAWLLWFVLCGAWVVWGRKHPLIA